MSGVGVVEHAAAGGVQAGAWQWWTALVVMVVSSIPE
jgi:hypothetical protein